MYNLQNFSCANYIFKKKTKTKKTKLKQDKKLYFLFYSLVWRQLLYKRLEHLTSLLFSHGRRPEKMKRKEKTPNR